MRKVLEEIIEGFLTKPHEMFQSGGTLTTKLHQRVNNMTASPGQNFKSMYTKHPIAVFLSFFIIELLVLLVGKYLLNNIVVKVISVARPVKSIWEILGLSILIKLLSN